jgi:hypothetical protein
MKRILLMAIVMLWSPAVWADDLCVSRVSFVESANILVLQSKWTEAPPLAPADGMWSQMFAALVGATFPVEVETAMDGPTIWWKLEGLLFKQSPSESAQSMEQALMQAMQPETGGSLRVELDGAQCFKSVVTSDSLTLTTPTGSKLRIGLENLKPIKQATKNPKARVYEYTGGAVLKLTKGDRVVPEVKSMPTSEVEDLDSIPVTPNRSLE